MPFLTFNSLYFLIFLLGISVLYYIMPNKLRWIVLLAASTIFYISAGIKKLPILVLTALIVFLSAKHMNKRFETAEQEADQRQLKGKERMAFLAPIKQTCRNRYLIPTIILVIAILCYCKFGADVFAFLNKNITFWTWTDIIVP